MARHFKVGDKVKQKYIYDNCPHNNMVAVIKGIRPVRFYPNGDYSVVEIRNEYEIEYLDGVISWAFIDELKGCGILSKFEKIKIL